MSGLAKIIRLIREFRHIPKTLYFNFHYFPPSVAIRLPVMVCRNVRLHQLKGRIEFKVPVRHRLLSVGFDYQESFWNVEGTIILGGRAYLSHGIRLSVGPNGVLELGNKIIVSPRTEIICFHKISIGDETGISWDVQLIDTDFHHIYDKEGNKINADKPIIIGPKNWIGFRAIIMKGSLTHCNTIIGAGSLVTNEFHEESLIIGGNPAKIIRRNIYWKE